MNNIAKEVEERVVSTLKAGIAECVEKSKKENLNAVDTLVLINDKMTEWENLLDGIINFQGNLAVRINELKQPYIASAKKEVAQNVATIIETSTEDVTAEVNDYMESLKAKGVDLSEAKNMTIKPPKPLQRPKEKVKERINPRVIQKPIRATSSNDDCSGYCGGTSGCGC